MIHKSSKICSNRGPNYPECRVYAPENREENLILVDHQSLSNRIIKGSRISNARMHSINTKLAKPKIQPKPTLAVLKLQHSSSVTLSQEDSRKDNTSMSTSDTAQPKADLCNELYKVTTQLADMRRDPRIPADGSYVQIVGKEKNSYELDSYLDSYECSHNPIIQNDCSYNEGTNLRSETNYLEIEDTQIAKCIHPIDSFETHMVKSKSLDVIQTPKHPMSKDVLSEMLYEPVQGIFSEETKFSTLSVPANVDQSKVRKNVTKYSKKLVDPKMHDRKKRKPSKEKSCPDSKLPSKSSLIFEDFSTDSELSKLGEQIRLQLEKKKK